MTCGCHFELTTTQVSTYSLLQTRARILSRIPEFPNPAQLALSSPTNPGDVPRSLHVSARTATQPRQAPISITPLHNLHLDAHPPIQPFDRARIRRNGTVRLRTEPPVWRRERPEPAVLLLVFLQPACLGALDAFPGKLRRAASFGFPGTIRRGILCARREWADGHGRVGAADRMACGIWHRRVCEGDRVLKHS
jgi:hypothetical protein